jgi:NADPH:quinone reductase-like Zn-dependent oxidoreductase
VKAVQVFQYGSPDVIQQTEIPCPVPGYGQLRVRVKAAGVGPWDALVREGRSGVPQTLPLTLGSDIAGIVDAIGPNVTGFEVGDEVYGVTNEQFTGGYAEFAIAAGGMTARKPKILNFIEAASAPVVAVTAWQMLFDYAHAAAGQTVLVQGGAGNVGAYAVQLAKNAGLEVAATASTKDLEYVRGLGANIVVDFHGARFEDSIRAVDVVIDTVGGETRERSLRVLKPGGILVSVVSTPTPQESGLKNSIKAVFFIVDVTTARLNTIAQLFDARKIVPQVGTVLPLEEARAAHRMLAGAPHARGKIVLNVTGGP